MEAQAVRSLCSVGAPQCSDLVVEYHTYTKVKINDDDDDEKLYF